MGVRRRSLDTCARDVGTHSDFSNSKRILKKNMCLQVSLSEGTSINADVVTFVVDPTCKCVISTHEYMSNNINATYILFPIFQLNLLGI